MKSFIQKRLRYKTAIAERFIKTYNKKKIFNKQFHHCEASIFVEKVTKSKMLKQILNLQVLIT